MSDIRIKYPYRVNTARLVEEMTTALGDSFEGISTRPGVVRVHLAGEPTEAQVQLAQAALDAHNPTAESQGDRDARQLRQRLRQLTEQDGPVSLADLSNESEVVRRLAVKVLLLEARLRR